MLSMFLVTALAVAQYPTPAAKPAAQDTAPAAGSRDTMKARTPTTAAALREDMRRLWSEHIALHHNSLVSAFAGLGDTAQIKQRLMRNQDEMGDAIKPFYGPAAGTQLATMLRGHITHAGHAISAVKATHTAMGVGSQTEWNRDTTRRSDVTMRRDTTMNARPSTPTRGVLRDTTGIKVHGDSAGQMMGMGMANKSGDTTDVNQAVAMLRSNADSIAAFLNSANPRHWPRATLQSALNMHVDLLVQATQARARGDWAASLSLLDASHRQARQMADMLADGIVKQFPTRFTAKTTAMTNQ